MSMILLVSFLNNLNFSTFLRIYYLYIVVLSCIVVMRHELNCIPKYMNFAIFSKDLLASIILQFCPAFWYQDVNIQLSVLYVYC